MRTGIENELAKHKVSESLINSIRGMAERHDRVCNTVNWIFQDAGYRAPETVGPETLRFYLGKLLEAVRWEPLNKEDPPHGT